MGRIIPGLEPLNFRDLFGKEIAQKPDAPTVSLDRCAECGLGFQRVHRMGRPVRFCGEECRRAHAAGQRREWNAASPPIPVTACRRCGQTLEIRAAGPGRARQYCSRRCLLSAENQPYQAGDLFDLANPKPNENKENAMNIPLTDEVRAQQSKAVARAVANLFSKLDFEPEIVFEGAVRGAAAAMMAAGVSAPDVGRLLENSGRFISTLDQGNDL